MKKTITLIIAAMMMVSFTSYAATADSADKKEMTQKQPKKAKKPKAEIKSVVFSVSLHCENCVAKVVDNISRAKGIKDLDVSLENQSVAMKYDATKTSEEILKAAIEKLGYPVAGKIEPGHEHDGHNHEHHRHDHGHGHQHK